MAEKNTIIETKMAGGFTMTSKIGNHTLYVDQPKDMGGQDTGPNPIQYFLVSLGGCMSAIARIIASQKNIELRSIKLKLQGKLDMDTLLGVCSKKRAGMSEIVIEADVDADMTADEKQAFLAEVESRCPISDNIANSTNLSFLVN